MSACSTVADCSRCRSKHASGAAVALCAACKSVTFLWLVLSSALPLASVDLAPLVVLARMSVYFVGFAFFFELESKASFSPWPRRNALFDFQYARKCTYTMQQHKARGKVSTESEMNRVFWQHIPCTLQFSTTQTRNKMLSCGTYMESKVSSMPETQLGALLLQVTLFGLPFFDCRRAVARFVVHENHVEHRCRESGAFVCCTQK